MKWLGVGVVVGTLTGCIIAQEEYSLSEVPIPRNRPPRIVERQVTPTERNLRGYGADRCELSFSVIVEDPDISSLLYAYWYVDYDPTDTRGADSEGRVRPTPGKTVRDERATFSSRVNSTNFNRLNAPGDHVVEVVISDTALVGREPEPSNVIRLDDGTDFVDPGYTASYVWFVRTEAGGNCP